MSHSQEQHQEGQGGFTFRSSPMNHLGNFSLVHDTMQLDGEPLPLDIIMFHRGG